MDKAEKQADQFDKVYQEAKTYLDKEINKIFDKFQRDYGLSQVDARQVLKNMKDKKDLNELRKVLEARPNDPNIQRLLADLDSPAYSFRMKRLERLSDDLDRIRESIYHSEKTGSDAFYSDLMKDSYYKATFDLQQQTGLAYGFSGLPESEIKHLQSFSWVGDGNTYSTDIWKNTGKLTSSIKDELLISLMTGRDTRETAQAIAERFNVGQNDARRLVRTESAFFHNQMELLSYEEADIEKYIFVAVLDKRTSRICQEHDNQVYDRDKAVPCVNCPPMLPWCRSTTVGYDEDADYSKLKRRARNPETGKVEYVPADMTYKEWYSKYVDGEDVVKESKPEVDDKVFVADKPSEIDDFFKKQKSYQKWYNELDEKQKDAIFNYTMSPHEQINSVMRQGYEEYRKNGLMEIEASEIPYVERYLQENLELSKKLETVFGSYKTEESFITYRGTRAEQSYFNNLIVGQTTVIDKAFMSTSLAKEEALNFSNDGIGERYLLDITVRKGSKSGVYISELSDMPEEKEFLIKPSAKFKVISVDKNSSGLNLISLELQDD
ncbi:minor capsid protein [Stenotrophomonas sp. Sm10]|uniref:minor capsid protein n=1 Tax=Stenotrophomonas sp. Sm10 TaxID=3002754 RepID=UPI0027E4D547|nr:minor capsid protein [Stenotrophomonas sp. Sm10]MDQ7313608.1 minor capsid protein [Stenotrophomonas sp. Sm10]